jgi:hypothetical protein
MGEMRSEYILGGKPTGYLPLIKPRRRLKDTIKRVLGK